MNSHKTAISRTKLSKPMHLYDHYGLLIGDVLDFGCGKGTDVEHLGIEGYDPFYFPQLPKRTYDTVTMNYVINTLVNHEDRIQAIRTAWRFVHEGGMLIVTARKVVDIHKEAHTPPVWKKHSDGYITGKETFQKGFTDDMIEDLLNNLVDGMIAKSPVKTSSFSHAIAVRTTRI